MGGHPGGLTGAAFATAICLPPTHRVLHGLAGRLVDRERMVMDARVGEFVRRVRDGEAEPEEPEELMRSVLGDPGLGLLVRLPSGASGAYVDLVGVPAEVPEGAACVPLTALEETRSSRERLALAAAAERERLARDLHDGTQQQIIEVGMRLRSAQRRWTRRTPSTGTWRRPWTPSPTPSPTCAGWRTGCGRAAWRTGCPPRCGRWSPAALCGWRSRRST
ncbi:histidine kinase [Actinomadura luteofluorescens]|uniref:histidine kinase n=1 Tax=Actinomadura luteofluorescens TaxID=46163 RepID=UPI0030CB1F11